MRSMPFLCLAAGGWLTGLALANEPAPPVIKITSILALNAHSVIHLESSESTSMTLLFSKGPLSSITIPSKRVTVPAGATMDVDLGTLAFPMGQQTFHIVSRVFSGLQNLPVDNGPALLEPLIVSAGGITKISYEAAFLSKRVAVPDAGSPGNDVSNADLGGFVDHRPIAALAFQSAPVAVAGQSLNLQYSPLVMAHVFDGKTSVTNVNVGAGTPLGGLPPIDQPRLFQSATSRQALDFGGYSIQGKFFLKLPCVSLPCSAPGVTYQAAWGWEAKAWQHVGPIWLFLGWSYVGGDGSWSIPVLPGLPVRVEYQPANRFVQLQDPQGNVYAWGDNWNQTGPVTDIGNRSADFTVNGDLPGVDKLYVGATNEWIKFFDNGMNALRDQPIEVTFPNSLASGHCVQQDTVTVLGIPIPIGLPYAWSCSQWSNGKIWIIPEHGDKSVVQHEIAHSINSFYWNGNLPPDAGGAHNMRKCYTNGLALTEGFANFVAYWVQLDRTASAPAASYYNFNLETLPDDICSGQTNEMRVAATFWDTYDYWNDGPDSGSKFDSLYYVDQVAPVSLYLNDPKLKMDDYLEVMKSGQPDNVKTEFEKLYRLNTIIN